LHSQWHFFGFALAHANAAIAIADHGQCGKTQDTAALDHLGNAVDGHNTLEVVALLAAVAATAADTVGCVTPWARAAALNEPCRATSTA
jgi:hypothetical protein